jgi:hypothetical protein
LNRILAKSLGGVLLAIAGFLLVVFTASMNAPQSMGGPMNLSPSSAEWFYIVLAVDALFLCTAWGGMKLLGLSHRAVGVLSLLVGIIILVLGAKNHIQSPPLDGVNDTNMMPVPPFLHYAVYSFVGICLFGGAWLITRPIQKRT